MGPEDIREFLRRQPFRPLRLRLTDGRIYEIHHPELAMVGRRTIAIGLPRPGDSEPVYDRLITVSLPQVVEVEPLETAPSAPAD